MNVKLYDSELKVMEVMWQQGEIQAARVCDILLKEVGWNPNTTYTIIKKCIAKGYIERKNPGFWCHALITKEEIRKEETMNLLERVYGGSGKELLKLLLSDQNLISREEIEELREQIQDRLR